MRAGTGMRQKGIDLQTGLAAAVIGGHFERDGGCLAALAQQAAGGLRGEGGGVVIGMAAFVRVGDDDAGMQDGEVIDRD